LTTSGVSPDLGKLALQRHADGQPRSEHVVHFYQESDSLLEKLCDFIGPALQAGSAAVIVATKVHCDGLEQRLAARGLDIPKAIQQGSYLVLDAPKVLSQILVDGMPDADLFAAIVGATIARTRALLKGQRAEIAVFGEMVSLLWAEGKTEAAIRLERLWNELALKHSFSLRCAYPAANFGGEKNAQPLDGICAEHSAVVFDRDDTSQANGAGKVALRRSEEQFRLMVDAVQDYAIFSLDPQGHVSSWNTGAQRIKGYAISEIIGKHFSVFYTEEDLQSGKPQRELEIAVREGRVEDEGWRLRKDGSRFWANVIISAIRDDSGELRGFGKVTRDFTEKIKASDALRKEIAERTEAQRRLHASEKSLRQLSLRLLQTQDEERRRIGRDLHDSVGQYLVGLKMRVDSLRSSANRGESVEASQLQECAQMTEEAIAEVRTISYLLYPPMLDELGLKSAIPWYLEGFTKRSGIKTTFAVSPAFERLPGDIELALFRVLQEALTNVHRHSGSLTADIRLEIDDRTVILQVSDAGMGSKSKNGEAREQLAVGVGLRGMTERVRQLGGDLEFSSIIKGTTVIATVPVPEAGSDPYQEK
jgi:PAS domain S-box-containing protein